MWGGDGRGEGGGLMVLISYEGWENVFHADLITVWFVWASFTRWIVLELMTLELQKFVNKQSTSVISGE